MPKEWPRGIADWTRTYQRRLEALLRVLESREDVAIASGALGEEQRLSGRMQESWGQAAFWADYGARKGWAFYAVWPMIDRKFSGDIPALNGYI
ncbi:Phosphotransferase enzyme family [Aspergillus sp. HF37]|nr:Phosphotransferase enzyme family [Aspergillus sp. HF37]